MNGEAYNPAAEANKMTEVTDGVYEITYTDVERWDNYQFKFTANGEWNPSWGADEDDAAEVDFLEMKQGGQNMILDLTKYIQEGEKATVKLVADLRNMDAKTHDGAVVRVYVNGKQINAMKTTTAVDGKKFTVIGKNLSGKTVILALYDADGRLVEVHSKVYSGEGVTFTATADYTDGKVMVWDSWNSLYPLSYPENVTL